jgi:hypothetical protein
VSARIRAGSRFKRLIWDVFTYPRRCLGVLPGVGFSQVEYDWSRRLILTVRAATMPSFYNVRLTPFWSANLTWTISWETIWLRSVLKCILLRMFMSYMFDLEVCLFCIHYGFSSLPSIHMAFLKFCAYLFGCWKNLLPFADPEDSWQWLQKYPLAPWTQFTFTPSGSLTSHLYLFYMHFSWMCISHLRSISDLMNIIITLCEDTDCSFARESMNNKRGKA